MDVVDCAYRTQRVVAVCRCRPVASDRCYMLILTLTVAGVNGFDFAATEVAMGSPNFGNVGHAQCGLRLDKSMQGVELAGCRMMPCWPWGWLCRIQMAQLD